MISIVSNQVVLGVTAAFATSAIYYKRKADGNLCMDPKLSVLVFGENYDSAQNINQFRIQPSNIRGYQY